LFVVIQSARNAARYFAGAGARSGGTDGDAAPVGSVPKRPPWTVQRPVTP